MTVRMLVVVGLVTLAISALPAEAELAGFPLPLGGDTWGSVVVADFNGDSALEIAVPVDNVAGKGQPAQGALYLVSRAGQVLPGWPVKFAVVLNSPSG